MASDGAGRGADPRGPQAGGGAGGASASAAPAPRDFAAHPAYQCALRVCGFAFNLETKFSDDEREVLYVGLKKASVEAGALLAAGFGRDPSPQRRDLWEQARSRLMEARHYVLVAQTQYMLDAADVAAFESLYGEMLGWLETLLAEAGFARAARRGRARGEGR